MTIWALIFEGKFLCHPGCANGSLALNSISINGFLSLILGQGHFARDCCALRRYLVVRRGHPVGWKKSRLQPAVCGGRISSRAKKFFNRERRGVDLHRRSVKYDYGGSSFVEKEK
ncbi:hypothetical protein NPIL_56351 [Nephila pilipes]|uniref:Uncharacterized protein n=1 Tax=Nephila pilipes TaxID=299642 RepID=A0A8X6NZY7_NEPPI|nr:hypothetical protein NPIL_56351 [Nephila pilipes]